MRVALMASAAALMVAACSATVPARCGDGEEPPPGLTCEIVVDAVRERLLEVPGVREIEVLWGGSNPSTARIVLWMLSGPEQAMLVVRQPDGSLQVLGPERIPAPIPDP